MRSVALLAVACGCNSIYSVDQTRLIDAPPPVDARPPPRCPGPGEGVPQFRSELNNIMAPMAQNYAVSTEGGISAGMYLEQQYIRRVAVGLPDEALAPVTVTGLPEGTIISVHLAPEGDALLVTVSVTGDFIVRMYEVRRPEGTWTVTATTDIGIAATGQSVYTASVSQPSRGPDRRIVFPAYDTQDNAAIRLFELADTGTGWSRVNKHSIIDFTKQSFESPSLTPDGLHMVFSSLTYGEPTDAGTLTPSSKAIYYTSRSALDANFETPQIVASVPGEVLWPFLTEDCGRIYFSALNTVIYLPY